MSMGEKKKLETVEKSTYNKEKTFYRSVILSKRSASKDLRTDSAAYRNLDA